MAKDNKRKRTLKDRLTLAEAIQYDQAELHRVQEEELQREQKVDELIARQEQRLGNKIEQQRKVQRQ